MVEGLTIFRDRFRGLDDCYVLIGGTACDLWMGEQALDFRATKDLDMVLVVEALRPEFFRVFWQFVKDAGYAGFSGGQSSCVFPIARFAARATSSHALATIAGPISWRSRSIVCS